MNHEVSVDDDMPSSLRDMLDNGAPFDFFEDNSRIKTQSKLSQSEVSGGGDEKLGIYPYHLNAVK